MVKGEEYGGKKEQMEDVDADSIYQENKKAAGMTFKMPCLKTVFC